MKEETIIEIKKYVKKRCEDMANCNQFQIINRNNTIIHEVIEKYGEQAKEIVIHELGLDRL